jgi:hypothetical protein
MIIFGSILNTFESSRILTGSWGSIENCPEPKTKPPLVNLARPNLWNALYDLLPSRYQSFVRSCFLAEDGMFPVFSEAVFSEMKLANARPSATGSTLFLGAGNAKRVKPLQPDAFELWICWLRNTETWQIDADGPEELAFTAWHGTHALNPLKRFRT